MIRVVLPQHLRALARIGGEVQLAVEGRATQGSVLDALDGIAAAIGAAVSGNLPDPGVGANLFTQFRNHDVVARLIRAVVAVITAPVNVVTDVGYWIATAPAELEEWLGRKLTPTLVYDYPTIDALARFLAGEGKESGPRRGAACSLSGASELPAFCRAAAHDRDAGHFRRSLMTAYFILKFLHVIGTAALLGTGAGIAFFLLMAHRTGRTQAVAAVSRIVVIHNAS